jgi:hypothetical protein
MSKVSSPLSSKVSYVGSSPVSGVSYGSGISPPLIPVVSPPMGKSNLGRNKRTFRSRKFMDKFVPKYNPSLEASLFNVRARSTNLRLANTGLVLRPIIVGGK